MQVSYRIDDAPGNYVPGYGQCYPSMVRIDPLLIPRIWDKRIRLGAKISDKIVDIVEKYGMANMDKSFLEQDSTIGPPNQELVKFHLYHWLYDCVATLDAAACLFNLRFEVHQSMKSVHMDSQFIDKLVKKNPSAGTLLSRELSWMTELKDVRNCIIHREGRMVVGGGSDPCVVIDFSRAFVKGLPLHRQRLSDLTQNYATKLDAFVQEVLSEVERW